MEETGEWMRAKRIKEIMTRLMQEMEEEDIGASLVSTFYQTDKDLMFFSHTDRERVVHILKCIAEDSLRHKKMLFEALQFLDHEINHEK